MADEDRRVLWQAARDPDQTWAYGVDADQVADVYSPAAGAAPRAQVLLLHGGFWRPEYDRRHVRPLASALADAGYAVVCPEYRRVPGQPDETTGDVLLAAASLSDTPSPLVVVGHSAGGHLALWLSAEPGIHAACLALAPVADLRAADTLGLDDDAVRAFLGGPPGDRPDLDPARRPRPTGAVTVLHGEHDSLVPVSISLGYSREARARHVVVPACGHFELIDPLSSVWSLVQTELARLVLNE